MNVYDTYSDFELTALIKEGNELAFAEIYDRYWAVLYRHARRILRNDEEVADIIQEVFLRLWTKAPEVELTTSLSAYLYASVRNGVLNYIDRTKTKDKYINSLAVFLDQGEFMTDNLIREKELAALIEKEIAALPDRMREVFELSRNSYLSHKEIAERLEISENTVKNQISKAIKILRVKLGVIIILYLFFHS